MGVKHFPSFVTLVGLLIITLTCTLLGLIVGHGQKQAMTEEMYNVIVRKLRGEFHVPVSERTRIQQNALVRLWRNQGVYSLSEDGQTLLCAGKPVMLQSNVDCVVKKGLDDTKGSGARKLSKRLKMHHSGISERKVQEILNRTEWYQLQNAKFLNKPPLMTIQAKEVQDRHQIDLLDMGKMKISYGQALYRYILTVMDVFSRYMWLKPLKRKSSVEIAKHLNKIYREHGPPKVLQHDKGTEFKGAVKILMTSLQVKIIESSAYHPQSQGKVERTHRWLRKKIMYDLVKFQRNGVNWVKHLPVYSRVLNEDLKEVLGWRSPFEVYYGRKSNSIRHPLCGSPSSVRKESVRNQHSTLPSLRHREKFDTKQKRVRRMARKASEHCAKLMIKRAFKQNLSQHYNVKDAVLVRMRDGAHRKSKALKIQSEF